MIAAGEFDSYIWNGTTYPRHNIVAFNASTGQPTSFAPSVDGEILTVVVSCTGSDVFIGGSFHHVGTVVRNYTAKVSLASGVPTTWSPNPNGIVRSIALMHNHLVVAGNFTTIGGVARSNIASVGQVIATVNSWLKLAVTGSDPAGPRKITKVVPNHAGTTAVIVGNFNTINGKIHRRIALLHLTDASVSLYPWATSLTASNGNANTGTDCSKAHAAPELDVTFTPGDARFLTASSGGGHYGSICDSVTKWDATTPTNTAARPMGQQFTGGDTVSAVVCSSDNCYDSGHFRWQNNPPIFPQVVNKACPKATPHEGYNCPGPTAVNRIGVAEFNITTMKATSWNPGRSRQESEHDSMIFTPQGLWIGSDGDTAAGIPRNDLVLFPFL
jgi:hypothetical protein